MSVFLQEKKFLKEDLTMKTLNRRIIENHSEHTSNNIYTCKSSLLQNEVAQAKERKKQVRKIIINENVSLNENLYAFIKECRVSKDREYLIIKFLIFENDELLEKEFIYSLNNLSKNFLVQLANKFKKFRQTKNFADLIGCAAVVVLYENKGFLNLKVIREASLAEIDKYIVKMEKTADEEFYEKMREDKNDA